MNETNPLFDPLFDNLSSLNLPDLTEPFPEHEQAKITDGEKFVVFFLDDELFAVPAEQVAEIVRPLDYTPLPNSPAWLHGVANLRGEIIPVLNLSKICGKSAAAADLSKSKLIVLKPKNPASFAAFPVDRLSEIITLNEKDIQPAEDSRLQLGRAVYKAAAINLLDTEKLFSSLLLG